MTRRKQVVQLARQYDALVISDDVYDFLNWSRHTRPTNIQAPPSPPPSPKSLPSHPIIPPHLTDIDHLLIGSPSPFGNTVSNGSFSKILGPGVRTGWAEASPAFIEGLAACGSTVSGGAPSQLMAAVIAETLRTKMLQSHLGEILVPELQRRRDLMVKEVERELVPLGVSYEGTSAKVDRSVISDKIRERSNIEGGYYVYLQLPPPVLAKELACRAEEQEGVLIGSGHNFEVPGDFQSARLCERGVRICFAWEDEWAIAEGIKRLGKVLKDMLTEER